MHGGVYGTYGRYEKLIPWQGRLEMSQVQMGNILKWVQKECDEDAGWVRLVQNKIISRSLSVVMKFRVSQMR
jgi:hypothetical protein